MPVEMNEDGTVNIIPPWSLAELLEAMNYEFSQGENGVITIQSSTPKAKSCFNCDFYDGEKCVNEQLGLVPLEKRAPPYTTVIKEKGCELFQSSESTERNES